MSDRYKGWVINGFTSTGTSHTLLLAPQDSPDDPTVELTFDGCTCSTEPHPQDSPANSFVGMRHVESDVTIIKQRTKAGDDEQTDIDQMTSLDWVHARDISYYHKNCTGVIAPIPPVATDHGAMTSCCPLCGMMVSSTLSHPSVAYPDNEARLA